MLLQAQSWQQQWLQLRQHLWDLMMMQPLEWLQVQRHIWGESLARVQQ